MSGNGRTAEAAPPEIPQDITTTPKSTKAKHLARKPSSGQSATTLDRTSLATSLPAGENILASDIAASNVRDADMTTSSTGDTSRGGHPINEPTIEPTHKPCDACRMKHRRCVHDRSGGLGIHSGMIGMPRATHRRNVGSDPEYQDEQHSDFEDAVPPRRRRRRAPQVEQSASEDDVPLRQRRRPVPALRSTPDTCSGGDNYNQTGSAHVADANAIVDETGAGFDRSVTTKRNSEATTTVGSEDATISTVLPDYAFVAKDNLDPFQMVQNEIKATMPISSARIEPDARPSFGTISRLKAKGVIFEEDSADEEMQDSPPRMETIRFPWQSVNQSPSLFDVAPMLRPAGSDPGIPIRGPKKTLKMKPEEVLDWQLCQRRAQFGADHAHRVLQRRGSERVIETTRMQDHSTQRWRHPLDNVVPEEVHVTAEEYFGLPAEAVVDQAIMQHSNELAFKDAERERESQKNSRSRARRTQEANKRWYMTRK